jgi:hypothetical protein
MRKQTLAFTVQFLADFSVVNEDREINLSNNEEALIECELSYSLLDEKGQQTDGGEGKGAVSQEYLTVIPRFGNALPFHLRDIDAVQSMDYKLTLPMFSGEKLVLSNLGRYFEDFQRILTDLRNEVIIKNLLMNEPIKKPDVNAEFIQTDDKGIEEQKRPTRIRLYETALVVIPQEGEFLRVPYSDISNVSEGNHSVRIKTERGKDFLFQRMGSEYDSFIKQFYLSYEGLQKKAISSLKALYPPIDSVILRRVAAIMKEGKAASRWQIEAVDTKLWLELEKRITSSGLNEPYVFLEKLGVPEKTAIGFKRGLMADLTGEYVWFLVPIYGSVDKGYGNALAMEAAETTEKPEEQNDTEGTEVSELTEGSKGKATYFFKIVDRKQFPQLKIEQMNDSIDNLIKTFNTCMLDINFRREPIYLPDDKLEEAEYVKYQIATRKYLH